MKKICQIHHYSYNGNTCPFCEKDKVNYLIKKYGCEDTTEETHKKRKEREINEEDIQKLKNKFNQKTEWKKY